MASVAGNLNPPLPGAGEDMVAPLREDLGLYPGPRTREGAATWTLHDRVRNRFFKVGWLEFEMLRRWRLRDTSLIAEAVNEETPLYCTPRNVKALHAFLDQNQLLGRSGPAAVQRLLQIRDRFLAMRKRVRMQQLMFLRMPLFKPDKLLSATMPYVRFVYTRGFALFMLLLGVAGLVLVGRQWEAFTNTFQYVFTLEGALLFGIAIFVTKAVHELGHAYTAKYLGLKVPTIGVALLVFWPVFYTDTTDSWRLRNHRHRLLIGIAGVTSELILAVLATFLWSFLPDGPLRSVAFFIAAVSWVLTLVVNLNPFLRWDGYYVLSDLWGVENLQQRSFALARWRLREWLWRLGDPPPEHFPPRQQRWLVIYAFATWAYRLVLFASIGLLVYQFLFKVVGLLLLVMVMNAFIVRPVTRELGVWWKRRGQVHWLRRIVVMTLFWGSLGVLLFVPWSSTIDAPALLRPQQHARLYAPAAARVAEVWTSEGQQVDAGTLLFTLDSPALRYNQRQVRLQIDMLEAQIARQGASDAYLERRQVLEQQLAEAVAEYDGNQRQIERLVIRAPVAGKVVDVADYLTIGRWIPADLRLASVVDDSAWEMAAYVREADLGRVRIGDRGRFYPDDTEGDAIDVAVAEIDQANIRSLTEPYNASVYGGRVAVQRSEEGELQLFESMYRLRMRPLQAAGPLPRMLRGQVRLEVESRSLIERAWRLVSAVLVRESGF